MTFLLVVLKKNRIKSWRHNGDHHILFYFAASQPCGEPQFSRRRFHPISSAGQARQHQINGNFLLQKREVKSWRNFMGNYGEKWVDNW